MQRVSGIGGSERHLMMLLPALKAKGVEVEMCVFDAGNSEDFVATMRNAGIATSVVPAGGDVDPFLIRGLVRVIRETSPDLVHTHLIHADVYGQVAASLSRVPRVSTIHGTAAPHRREPSRTAAMLAGYRARRTIAISQHVARFVQDRRLAPTSRVRVIPYGIDSRCWTVTEEGRRQRRSSLGFDSEIVVVVASRLVADKGHDALLDAFSEAIRQAPDLRLIIAGTGPLRASLGKRVSRLGLTAKVQFLGFVDDIGSLLGAGDLVAFPSLPGFGEGFGLVNLEAMAVGRPVVATAIDSMPEIVVAGETGLLVPPGNTSELTNALATLARDASLRARMGAAGRERAVKEFPLERMVERTITVYREIYLAA